MPCHISSLTDAVGNCLYPPMSLFSNCFSVVAMQTIGLHYKSMHK